MDTGIVEFKFQEGTAGVSYHTLYRAVCRGDLKIIKGFGRMMVSDSELARFVANVTEYLPKKRQR
jgi:hypothetical protein